MGIIAKGEIPLNGNDHGVNWAGWDPALAQPAPSINYIRILPEHELTQPQGPVFSI